MQTIIAPSILAADHARLGEEIKAVQLAGADWIHIDVMDGHFVPNLTFGPPVITSLRGTTQLPFDVHLMIEHPENSLAAYVQSGASHITVHAEACVHLHRTLQQIRDLGAQVGVSLNPATPLESIAGILHMVDIVLVMTVNPGFGGQKFIPEVLSKIVSLAHLKKMRELPFHIAADGGVTVDTVQSIAQAGADVFIAGSAIFASSDYKHAIAQLRANSHHT